MPYNPLEKLSWHVALIVLRRVLVAALVGLVAAGLIPVDVLQQLVDILRDAQEAVSKPLSLLSSRPLM